MRKRRLIVFMLACVFAMSGYAMAAKYGLRTLPMLPGCISAQAMDINNRGQIVGECFDAKGGCPRDLVESR